MTKPEEYFSTFNRQDEEYHPTDIDNAHAAEWLTEEIPTFECPDTELEKTYYFRWWTFRKHIKKTPEGYLISEFLPDVCWSGRYNMINAAVGHHIMEGRWLKHADRYLKDDINFFLTHREEGMRYSAWLIWAAKEYQYVTGKMDIPSFLDRAIPYFREWITQRQTDCGLYWSIDGRDAMEYSISGTVAGKMIPGVRPTLNSYLCGDAKAIFELSRQIGRPMYEYLDLASDIAEKMQKLLWRDGFFKALHPADGDFSHIDMETSALPRELIGYIPWYFGIPKKEQDGVFDLLADENCFAAPYGLATADRSHPSYLFKAEHECLWNGYVWPFATSQTLTALLCAVDRSDNPAQRGELFYRLLKQYAGQHTLIKENGEKVMWIDEVRASEYDEWYSRRVLRDWGWKPECGGYERGKDYNHSTFCDLVISGIGGVRADQNGVHFKPIIPAGWDYFRFDKVYIRDKCYRIQYDKNGEKYGEGEGFSVFCEGRKIR